MGASKKARRSDDAARDESPDRAMLAVERVLDVPLREVSGLCLVRLAGEDRVLGVGDSTTRLAHALLTSEPSWETFELGDLLTDLDRHDPQLEGITADAAGCVVLLQEGPARAVAVETAQARRITVFDLVVAADTPVGCSWRDDDTSRGEAIVLLRGGHLLVAKEKRPTALIEFGPPGDPPLGLAPGSFLPQGGSFEPPAAARVTYEALAVWPLGPEAAHALRDVSDATIGPDGRLYLLSDKSASIGRVAFDGHDEVHLDRVWTIEGRPEKAEGLAILPDGRAVVALDTKHPNANLLVLGPVVGEPSARPS